MAAELPEAGMVAPCIAVGCAEILKPLLSFLEGAPARGHGALDAAAVLVFLAVVMANLAGVILIYLHVAPAGGAPVGVVLAAFRQFVLFVCALLHFVASLFRLGWI